MDFYFSLIRNLLFQLVRLKILIVIIMYHLNCLMQEKKSNDVRDNHHTVEAVCHIPYEACLLYTSDAADEL